MLKRIYDRIIGIDPGVETGFAIWYPLEKRLVEVKSSPIHEALLYVITLRSTNLLIRLEDARKRRWFGRTGPEVWKGAGSIMRDCKIWEDFLLDNQIEHELVAPKHNKTKISHDYFTRLTGWTKPTNEHSRDAAMLVFGL